MSNVCSILAHVERPDGSIVESKLFKDLLLYTNNRSEAKEHYAVATNNSFLEKAKGRIEFDENGEATFKSYKEVVQLKEKNSLLERLNKDVDSGIYTYKEAIGKLQFFNRNNPYNKEYMATLTYDKGKYKLEVVKRTKSNEIALEDIIYKQSLQDRIMYYLNQAGVTADFIEKDGREDGRYSTVNAEKAADGLYHLIKISNGENVTETLAEEAGHFAVGALGDSLLVTRLMSLLTEDVQKSILGEDYKSKILGTNPRREIAGHLVGKALQNNVNIKTPWGKLAKRVADMAKRIFYKIKGDEVKAAALEAKRISRQIAEGFMSPTFNGTVDKALTMPEIMYSAKPSYEVSKYKEITQRLEVLVKELQAVAEDDFTIKMQQVRLQVEAGRGLAVSNPSLFADTIALQGIAEAASLILDKLGPDKEIDSMLKSINFDNIEDFKNNLAKNGRTLRQVRIFLKNSIELERIINDAISTTGGKQALFNTTNIVLPEHSVNLHKVLKELQAANNIVLASLTTKEKVYFSKFLADCYGEKYINFSAQKVIKKISKLAYKTVETSDNTVAAEDYINQRLESLEEDINLYERYLASMSNSSDIIGQIADKITKNANKQVDDLTSKTFDELRLLKKELHELGYKNTDFLFEKDSEGKLTGNIISQHHWGEYEKERNKFFEEEKKKFKEVNSTEGLSEMEVALQWHIWISPKYKQWNKENSTYNNVDNIWVPNKKYDNPQFESIVPSGSAIRDWYNRYMEIKQNLDSLLPEGSTMSVRMPQFKGTFANQLANRRLYENPIASFRHTLRQSIIERFSMSSEDRDYGSLQTYNTEDEQLYHNEVAMETEDIHRLPLFGINKLENMEELSTDLFHTTLAYASMAYSYKASESIVDALEVGSEVLSERKVGGVKRDSEKKGKGSNAYNRYLKFLEKQVYGISVKRSIPIRKIVLDKVIATLGKITSVMFLGGNVPGGLVNLGTGNIEILKEAATGEFFNMKDVTWAKKKYWNMFIKDFGHIQSLGKVHPDDKMSLLIRHFNMRGENKVNFRNWKTRHSWIYNATGESIFLPYKMGDHYMQTMGYLMAMHNTKVYTEGGTEMCVFDAYEVVQNKNDDTIAGRTIRLKEQPFFKSKEGKQTYDMINSILSKMSSPFGYTLTSEEQEYIDKYVNDIMVQNSDNIVTILKENANKLLWSIDDESSLMDKAREINNRMHGIYNRQDEVALSQNLWGRAFLSMKGWALGMAERRFAKNHYSVALGKEVEGSLNTLMKVWADSISKGTYSMALRATLLPIGQKAENHFMELGWSPHQWRNMRRNFFDTMTILILKLLRALTALPPEEEDDEFWKLNYGKDWKQYKEAYKEDEDVTMGIIYYFANRLYREQSALNNPKGWYYEMNTLLDVCPPALSGTMDLLKLVGETAGLPFADESDSKYYYQQEGPKNKEGDSKAKIHFYRYLPYSYQKSWHVFEHPYEAAESYEFGRNVKQR
jgi:hypothetical protein